MTTERVCSIDGCDGAHEARGFCLRHYAAWYRASGKVKEPEGPCVMDGCDRPANGSRGWCERHYSRWRKWGDPAIAQRPLDPQAPPPTYDAMHQRVRRARGRPPAHACVDCGSPAEQWSYDHTDPAELRGPTNGGRWTSECAYSLDVDRYQPRCRPCHMQFDRGVPPNHCNRGHEFTPENTYSNPHGKRTCRTCMATWYREHKAEQRARQREYRARGAA